LPTGPPYGHMVAVSPKSVAQENKTDADLASHSHTVVSAGAPRFLRLPCSLLVEQAVTSRDKV
jgi:hypothetical protein